MRKNSNKCENLGNKLVSIFGSELKKKKSFSQFKNLQRQESKHPGQLNKVLASAAAAAAAQERIHKTYKMNQTYSSM